MGARQSLLLKGRGLVPILETEAPACIAGAVRGHPAAQGLSGGFHSFASTHLGCPLRPGGDHLRLRWCQLPAQRGPGPSGMAEGCEPGRADILTLPPPWPRTQDTGGDTAAGLVPAGLTPSPHELSPAWPGPAESREEAAGWCCLQTGPGRKCLILRRKRK